MLTRTLVGLWALLVLCPSSTRADVVLDWNTILISVVSDQPPPLQNRFAAITQVAVFEAVNAVTGGYTPYVKSIAPRPGASPHAAAVSAAYHVLRAYFPGRTTMLDDARARSLQTIPDGPAKAAGLAVGEEAAAAIVAARLHDGAEPPEFHLPTLATPGEWQLTPECPPAGGVFLHWRTLVPFVIQRAEQFRSDPPPALGGPAYARDYREVALVGGRDSRERSPDRTNVARLYADLSDAALWNLVARQLAAAHPRSLTEHARVLALLNMALNDAGIAVMETKYHYNVWRPETAIRAGAADGNERTEPDPAFEPFIRSPCFPSYPSGHGATSHAARTILERAFGGHGHAITLRTPSIPEIVLRYRTIKAITADIDDARVYAGVHFRFDQVAAAEQGRALGAYVHRHSLRPVKGCRCDDDAER